jgi:hypoxanthine phosphoribosyltransferase
MEKRFIPWRDIDDSVERLTINITNSKIKLSAIKGIPRGGMILAVMLSHRLKIPLTTDGVIDNTVLVVDDICDSGHTLKNYEPYRCPTATIHYKTTAEYEPHFWWRLAPANEWIVYPWENKDSQTIADYATKRK